ncbi:MAG: hypothetical protein IT271_07685 [Chitinophagales bacterium]|nr:hypothetical protein [Chitinophagales bacterium]
MTYNINDFLSINQLKNGRFRLNHDITNRDNAYKTLHLLGFRKTRLDKKSIYYKREETVLRPVDIYDLQNAFEDFLQTADFENIPSNMERSELINWLYDKEPIKKNCFSEGHIWEDLTEKETHELQMLTNATYKKIFETQELISKLKEWNFVKTIDSLGSFCKGNPLYYKSLGSKKYLVFNHYNSEYKDNDGFDCWLATFNKDKEIGLKRPTDNQSIQLSFNIDRDFILIKNYLN